MSDTRFWSKLISLVSGATVVVDRPKKTAHPRIPELIYPLDYGFLRGTRSGDGHGIDVWIGSLKSRAITGVVCTVDSVKRDSEVKVLLGCSRADQRRILSIHNHSTQGAVLIRPEPVRAIDRGRKRRRTSSTTRPARRRRRTLGARRRPPA